MFSKLTQNAVNTMLWVCKHQDTGPVTTDIVSKRLGLSVSYLESLFSRLKKQGFVVSYRGPGGGYCTQSKPSELMLLDLVKHFDFQEQNVNVKVVAVSLYKNLFAISILILASC